MDGSLQPGPRVAAAKVVMPMAVSPDKRFLYAAVRSEPYEVQLRDRQGLWRADAAGKGPLAESYPYIALDRTRSLPARRVLWRQPGRRKSGRRRQGRRPAAGDPDGRNAHAIRIDSSNRFVYVPHLGTDQIFQFVFDEKSGRLSANTPPVVQLKPGTGPRHLIVSQDNRFVYLLNELTATVTTLALEPRLER